MAAEKMTCGWQCPKDMVGGTPWCEEHRQSAAGQPLIGAADAGVTGALVGRLIPVPAMHLVFLEQEHHRRQRENEQLQRTIDQLRAEKEAAQRRADHVEALLAEASVSHSQQIAGLQKEIKDLTALICEKDALITKLNARLDEQKAQLDVQDAKIAKQSERIAALEANELLLNAAQAIRPVILQFEAKFRHPVWLPSELLWTYPEHRDDVMEDNRLGEVQRAAWRDYLAAHPQLNDVSVLDLWNAICEKRNAVAHKRSAGRLPPDERMDILLRAAEHAKKDAGAAAALNALIEQVRRE